MLSLNIEKVNIAELKELVANSYMMLVHATATVQYIFKDEILNEILLLLTLSSSYERCED